MKSQFAKSALKGLFLRLLGVFHAELGALIALKRDRPLTSLKITLRKSKLLGIIGIPIQPSITIKYFTLIRLHAKIVMTGKESSFLLTELAPLAVISVGNRAVNRFFHSERAR